MSSSVRPPVRGGAFAAAALALDNLDDLIVQSVREVHTSISGRIAAVAGVVGGGPGPVLRIHDGIAGGVYAGIHLGLAGGASALRLAHAQGLGPSLEEHPRGQFVMSAINGLIGDQLREADPDLSFGVSVRVRGRDVEPVRNDLAAAYPDASGALVVFAHGLCENETYWSRRRRPRVDGAPEPGSYGDRLSAHGWTPVQLRVNTGLPIAESGVEVHALLARLVREWPVEVRRIALVGHSMGGLIFRAAASVAADEDSWAPLVTDLVTLGTPHLGSPVERSIARGLKLSTRVPELAPYTRIFSKRARGVLDLHDGMPLDEARLPHARYHLVAATLTRSARHPLARSVGDLLVQPRSALAMTVTGESLFVDADRLHVPCSDHFDLLNHDRVYAAIRRWLGDAQDPGRTPSPPPSRRGHTSQEITA